jgi:hypothetical protein
VKSLVSKRSIVIAGHKTSVSLEDQFWNSLKEIAGERNMTLAEFGFPDRPLRIRDQSAKAQAGGGAVRLGAIRIGPFLWESDDFLCVTT